MKYKAKAAVCS